MLHLLDAVDGLQAALTQSVTRPVVIFKHSLTCGTSAMAMEEMQDLVASDGFDTDVYVVQVQRARAVSGAIESAFGIRHESPQVLVIANGQVVWHASHFRVTAASVRAAVLR